jgi:hypothetical protein
MCVAELPDQLGVAIRPATSYLPGIAVVELRHG